jgi:hypothetical protein
MPILGSLSRIEKRISRIEEAIMELAARLVTDKTGFHLNDYEAVRNILYGIKDTERESPGSRER